MSTVLLAEPTQPNFYPTLKVGDFGLAYSVPTDIMSVRQFKRSYWVRAYWTFLRQSMPHFELQDVFREQETLPFTSTSLIRFKL